MHEPITTLDGASRINEILARQPRDHRIVTYGLALSNIPLPVLEKAEKVIEVGMNDSLFVFEELFKGNTQFLGITLNGNHKEAALKPARRLGHSVDVRLHDLKDGLPIDWKDADLVMDIFSASNYWDAEKTVKILADSLRENGYMLIVSGDIMGGIGDFVRNNLKNKSFHPQFIFDISGNKPKLEITVEPGITEKEAQQKRSLEILRENLRLAGYNVPDEASIKELVSLLKDMAGIIGEKVITSYDALTVYQYHVMEKAGLKNIKRFLTPDGTGMVAQK